MTGDQMHPRTLALLLILCAPSAHAASYWDVCPDVKNDRVADMQMSPDEFTEEAANTVIELMRTNPDKGLVNGELGRPIDSWWVVLRGYVLRAEWLRAKAENKDATEVERRRKMFCEFLVSDGFYID